LRVRRLGGGACFSLWTFSLQQTMRLKIVYLWEVHLASADDQWCRRLPQRRLQLWKTCTRLAVLLPAALLSSLSTGHGFHA
jgi:hypothetical protein